jgi:DNA mismatch repair protein MutS2
VRKAQREADEVLRDLRNVVKETGREGKETEAVRGRLRTLQEKVQSTGRQTRGKGDKPQSAPTTPQEPVIPTRTSPPELRNLPKSGDIVRVKSLGREAVLLEEIHGRERVAVRVGAMRLQVPARDLEAVTPRATGGGAVAVQLNKTLNVVEEVNVIGQTTDEALLRLEKYLDDAVLSGVNEVRIIHGRGSGALRSFIQRWLRDHPNVESFATAPQNMGGEGATIVKLG